MRVRPTPLPALPSLVLSAVLLAACGTGGDPAASAPVPSAAVPSAAGSTDPASTPAVRTVEVAYAGGEVTGTSGREEVPVGEQVVLRVSSDVAEEVHVHGYDVQAAVPAGGTVDIPVVMTIPGVFEVELHESGRVLFQLRVA